MARQEITVRLPTTGRTERLAAAVDRLVAWLARHWLALFNAIVAVFVGLPFAAPLLMHLGATGPARLIYWLYRFTCHQLPERSFFLFGAQAVYSVEELEAAAALPAGLGLLQRELLRWVGNAQLGYKVAICQRDVAIYGSILVGGLLFGLARRFWATRARRLPRLSVKAYLVALIPLVLDGGTQLVGWRESTWPLRLLTGGLFGMATVWLAYPYVAEAMADAADLHRRPPETGQNRPDAV
ncbi:MAG: DUF2085 domain-containing protein [Anaerolineae bacterium]|nr:DUF2085 domain-containing protein [Anaerolineae bacterium]